MQKEKYKLYFKWGLTVFLTACALLVFFDVFYKGGMLSQGVRKLVQILAPILYGMAMAYLLAPIVNWLEKWLLMGLHRIRPDTKIQSGAECGWLRGVSITLTWLFVLAMLYLLMSVLVPQLVESITALINNAENYYNQVYAWVNGLLEGDQQLGSWLDASLEEYYQTMLDYLTKEILPGARQLLTSLTGGIWTGIWSVLGFFKNLLIGIIVSVYLLWQKERGAAGGSKVVYALLKEEQARFFVRGVRRADMIFSGFVRGKLLDSLIIAVICFVACSLLNMPYTPLVSVVVGVTNIIPFFGPFLGAIPSALLILLVSPMKCLYFVIMVVALQQLDGNVIGPKILGDSTGISSFWVIVAILVGGGLFGLLGMFLGVPVCACLQVLGKFLINRRLNARNMPTDPEAYANRDREPPEPAREPSDQEDFDQE